MADSSVPVPSLSRAREEKISELSTHFANDDLSLEDLERRIERVYKAANVAELEDITAGPEARRNVERAGPAGEIVEQEGGGAGRTSWPARACCRS